LPNVEEVGSMEDINNRIDTNRLPAAISVDFLFSEPFVGIMRPVVFSQTFRS